ncbi:MAG: succinylglutamate desuccinylase/aspartoacylase family protein [Pyrinomonadaceae bacterium]|nr:succinylglutamate desuccinylase/aspartoacylase family protein [Pyrinomonadaceae bacterium]
MQILSIPEKLEAKHVEIVEGEHLIGEFVGDETGATLVVFGSVHGNEAAGALALQKIAKRLPAFQKKLHGRVYFLAGNTRAVKQSVRFIDSDLNRHWTLENIKHNSPNSHITTKRAEDLEQTEILILLEKILKSAKDEVYALDLHSTSAAGVPFATVGDTLRNRDFAQKFPITILLGIEEQLDGTILEYLNNTGAVTLGYEGGQHFADSTIAAHEALVWLALVNSGILAKEDLPGFEKHTEVLRRATGKPRIVEIRYRHAITESDNFKMELGFENFQPVKRGELLAYDRKGAIKSAEKGLILMPLYQTLGEDGFFTGREVAPFWLKLSGFLRRWKIGNLMRFLPGVKRSEFDAETFEINTKIARIFPLQIFHLLGFRKRRWRGNKLVVSRRRFDTESPFVKKI